MRVRHKASTPNLTQMKEQAAASVERNAQRIGEVQSKLVQLRKQHQTLQSQQKDLNFDPEELGRQAAQLEAAASDAQARIDAATSQRLEAQRNYDELRLAAQREG